MGWIKKTAAVAGVVAAAGLTAGAAAHATQQKEKEAQDKDRQVRVIERVVGPQAVLALVGPRLGVGLEEVTEATAREKKLQVPGGALVADVQPDSPAAKAGLQEGDVIVEFDGERVRGVRQMQRLVSETPPDRPVRIVASRDGKRVELSATLEQRDLPEVMGLDRDRLREQIRKGVEEGMRGMREFRWAPGEPGQAGPGEREPRVEPRWPMFQWSLGAGRLGVTVQELTPQLLEHFRAPNGVLVASVSPDSAAERAGIKAGDVITAVAGKKVETTGDLVRSIRSADEGAEVEIAVVRDGKEQTLKAKLGPGPTTARRGWTV